MHVSFPLVVVNVFALFAMAAIVVCWFSALVAIHHRKMKSAVRIPLLAGAIVVGRLIFGSGIDVVGAILVFVATFLAASMAISYVYGWAMSRRFDEDELNEGSGRFAPILYVWTGSFAFIAIAALVNLAVTGTLSPARGMGF